MSHKCAYITISDFFFCTFIPGASVGLLVAQMAVQRFQLKALVLTFASHRKLVGANRGQTTEASREKAA